MEKKKNNPLQAPVISSDFDVDEIRAMREYNSLRHAHMTPDEIIKETRESTAEFMEWLVHNNESENGVRVISAGEIGNSIPRNPVSSKGVLSLYADPTRQSQEFRVWEQGAIEKHIAHERAEAVEELLRDFIEDGIISAEEAEKYTQSFFANI